MYGIKHTMFTNHKSLQYILNQRELNVRPCRLFNDYDCKIRYHLAKENVAADTLSRKERAKPLRVGALVMTINSNLPLQIHEAQVAALKKENVKKENLHGTDTDFETRLDRTLCIRSRNWLSHYRDLRKLIMHGSHKNLTISSTLDRMRYIIVLEAIQFTGITRNTPLEMGKYSHGFYHKPAKDNKLLLHDLDEIQTDDKLYFVEEPMEIMDREVKRLKQSGIHYVKVRWNSRRGPELTREREDRFQKKYPHLIANLHHRQMPQLELQDEAHLTGKGCHTP
ncbi:hypothetical protein Tco_1108245 [Tanacetum coccineum]